MKEKIADRISELQEMIEGARSSLRESKSLGGHSCYGAGYDQGNIDAYEDELVFLTKLVGGKE